MATAAAELDGNAAGSEATAMWLFDSMVEAAIVQMRERCGPIVAVSQ